METINPDDNKFSKQDAIIANNIRALLEFYGESYNDMATKLGLHKSSVGDWVNLRNKPRKDKLLKIKEVYNIKLKEFTTKMYDFSTSDQSKDLKSIANSPKKELNKAKSYMQVGKYYKEIVGNFSEAYKYYLQAYKLRKRNLGKYNKVTLVSLNEATTCIEDPKRKLHNYHTIRKFYAKIFGKYFLYTAVMDNNVGLAYIKNKEYDKAEKYLKRALKIYKNIKEIGDRFITAEMNLGCVYMETKTYDKALFFLNKALHDSTVIYQEVNDTTGLIYLNIGHLYYKQEKYEIAIEHYFRAENIFINIYEEPLSNKDIGILYKLIGNVYKDLKQIEESFKYYNKSYDILSKLFDESNENILYLKTVLKK